MSFEEFYNKLNPELKKYYKIICPVFPKFLIPFIESKTLQRLDKISYFCGSFYGSPFIFNFKYDVSRLEHSISTALIVWMHTFDEMQTLAALFHDATTPAFSHVIDYLNGDALTQESTELDLVEYLKRNDPELLELFKNKGVDIRKVANFKDYSLVDNERPRMCADRLDYIFVANLAWSREVSIEEVRELYKNVIISKNEDGLDEFSVIDICSADRLVELNDIVNLMTKWKCEYTSMNMLALMVSKLISKGIICYDDLFVLTDLDVYKLIEEECKKDSDFDKLYREFKALPFDNSITSGLTKDRKINPLVKDLRYSTF